MRKVFMTLGIIVVSALAVSAQTTEGFETKPDGKKIEAIQAKAVTVNKPVTSEKPVKTDAVKSIADVQPQSQAKGVAVENSVKAETPKVATAAKPVTKVAPANTQKIGMSDKRTKENKTKN
ncbi:MAG TPA: hypothetical protein VK484_06330 [Ferruginibacter sp.]|nr:hypothetical protein [Ferruginibacter sp.]